MASVRFEAVTIDCRDSHQLGAFWCALLGTTVRGEFGQYLGLHPTAEGGLGASVVQEVEGFGARWRVLADPEGNQFCLVPAE